MKVILPVSLATRHRALLAAPLVFLTTIHAGAAVVPNALFSSHAVLQRDREVPVWGSADEGESVTVKIAGQSATAITRDGKWMVRLKPMKADAKPQKLTISGTNTIVLDDILIGEVWLCGGQSNMEWTLAKSANGKAVAAGVKEPEIRLFRVPRAASTVPVSTVKTNWTPCDAKNAAYFSGVGFYFGKELRQALGVPVGLIGSYVGGTPAELWTSEKSLVSNPALKDIIARQRHAEETYDPAKAQAAFEAAKQKYAKDAEAAKAAGKTPPREPQLAGNPKGRGPASLYNAMIAPLQPYAMRGVIWYQGEANRANPGLYLKLFPALIADWRAAWGIGDFPFLFVQLAPFGGCGPEIREVQTMVWKSTPNTAMAVITDHGEANTIHPPAKEPVGHRLALAARALAYGEKIVSSGPIYKSMEVKGNKATLEFTSIGTGLAAAGNDGKLKGFTIAGPDHQFVPADAVINGDKVEVSSQMVAAPTAVRFAWANVPDANLFNKEGLPAAPFRTDTPSQ